MDVPRAVGCCWADAKTTHGKETRQKRANTRSKLGELYALEVLARAAGVITEPKVRGRAPRAAAQCHVPKIAKFQTNGMVGE